MAIMNDMNYYSTNFTDTWPEGIGGNVRDSDDDEHYRTLIAYLVITAAALGLLLNCFVIILSFFYVQGDFRYFIANLALVDALCAVLFAFVGFVNLGSVSRGRFSFRVLKVTALAFYGGSFGMMVCALVPVSISRLVAATRPQLYERLFTQRMVFVVCFVFDTLPLAVLIILADPWSLWRPNHTYWLIAHAAVTILAYLLTFVCNTLVFRKVARHIAVVGCLQHRSRLLETRQVAIATLAQAIVPLFCQVPAFLALASALVLDPLISAEMAFVTQLWLAANPLFDALITICVIR
uniref:G protein-coupled receptor n=1 Tax=Plectus sambesii TaxID=2011161 RepID=A0A914USY0_9BILA